MPNCKKVFTLAAVVLGTGVSSAGQAPVPVSPGDPETLALVEARCPTFSWATVDGAVGYELVVYQVAEQGEKAEPVLRQSLPGGVSSWTPSFDRCLARAGRYAWSVGAAGPAGSTEWSKASLFQVASASSELAFEEALEIVRSYLATEAERAGLAKPGAVQERDASAARAGGGGQNLVASSVDLLVTDGDIAVTSANAAGAHAYIQMDTLLASPPPASSCNDPSEYGRLIYRLDGEFLYLCDDNGWRDLNCASPPC